MPESCQAKLNADITEKVLEYCLKVGVTTFCICPGGRNAPFVHQLDRFPSSVKVYSFFEERSAAFFALGRAKSESRPVAVITTSGTAACELLPAMVEAFYSQERLIVITADRPKKLRHSGAPQTIIQPQLYGHYAQFCLDLDTLENKAEELLTDRLCLEPCPAHINVCFDEPLIDETQKVLALQTTLMLPAEKNVREKEVNHLLSECENIQSWLKRHRRPLVFLGHLDQNQDLSQIEDFCLKLGAPILAEASSHLRSSQKLENLLFRAGEKYVKTVLNKPFFDSVLRLGSVPSFKVWRELEDSPLSIFSVVEEPFAGISKGQLVCTRIASLCQALLKQNFSTSSFSAEEKQNCFAHDRKLEAKKIELLTTFSKSEPGLVRELSIAIPSESVVYLGNSLPIREWNTFGDTAARGLSFFENRGVNGIDGQLSSFFGTTKLCRENWAILGDLTLLYDLSSPWILKQLPDLLIRIVIVNNRGGRIFEHLYKNPAFVNQHDLSFEKWASFWSLDYVKIKELSELSSLKNRISKKQVVELMPDLDETRNFWEQWKKI